MAESKKPESFPQRVVKFFKILWLQYQMLSCTYMMETWEARVFNALVLLILCTAGYTTYLYLPSHIMMIVSYLQYLLGSTGDTSSLEHAGTMQQSATQ